MQIVFGVIIAVAAFVIQEVIRYFWSGMMFRRRLAVDIRLTVEDFQRCVPELERAVGAIKSTASQLVLTPLWNTAYDGLADMYKNAAHLNVSLFPSAVHFYDACGRFEEIRQVYNETLAGIVATHDGREERIVMLNCLASDMKKAIEDTRDTGNELLTGLRSVYRYDGSLIDAIGPIRASIPAD